ncbi:amidohydrolase [Seminavis robusta]|uniref:Amidohydrolase n=1 Tax=Seminavis robusta TaxID=568900 RepID=A0A9N8DC73_9STRA|nr:amidohydrolase [Seminavis robusta]|eukprot:Sro56_g032620.1 amidohydrolase (764) ;mRNA; f:14936-17305
MKKLSKVGAVLRLLFVALATVGYGQEILFNAKVYTVDPANPEADAIAFDQDGIIVGVGTFGSLVAQFPDYLQTDLDGLLVLPGFQDVHQHPVEYGINSQVCEIGSEGTIEDIPFWFDDPACINGGVFGDQGWVMGAGVDLEAIVSELESNPNARYPIQVLDESFPNTPVVILDQLGHGALANTAAMQQVGYLDATSDPPGGQILRDPDDGSAIGIVTENAQQKLREAAFPPTDANKETAYQGLLLALEELASNGITTVSDAGGFWRQAQTESWARAEEEGALTVRASNALYIYPDEPIAEQIPKLQERVDAYANYELVRFNQAKIYVDGILSLSTGKLYDPYTLDLYQLYRDDTTAAGQWRGFEYFGDNVTLNAVTEALVNMGLQMHFHVTGDHGARLALEAISAVQQSGTASIGPHRLTHCYMVDELDRPLFEELGVVADLQLAPTSLTADYQATMTDFLGAERAATLLPAVELYEAGAMITLSSDWDADDLSPLVKMQTVLTRTIGRPFPDIETIIPMFTLNGAKLLQHDDLTGSIEVGKYADLVVLDQDIFNLPADQIATANVTLTYLQGEVIYDADSRTGPSIPLGSGAPNTPSPATGSPQPEGSPSPSPAMVTTQLPTVSTTGSLQPLPANATTQQPTMATTPPPSSVGNLTSPSPPPGQQSNASNVFDHGDTVIFLNNTNMNGTTISMPLDESSTPGPTSVNGTETPASAPPTTASNKTEQPTSVACSSWSMWFSLIPWLVVMISNLPHDKLLQGAS